MTTTNGSSKAMELLKQLKPNPKNPRILKKDQYEKLKQSLREFPQMLEKRPLIYKNFIVYGGNMRLRALQELAQEGLVIKDTYFQNADDWTEEQIQQFIIKDNLSYGDWDWDMLANEWDKEKLDAWGMDTAKWKDMDEDYSQKLGEIIYEPKETNHKPKDLFKVETKFDKDIEAIKNPELKEMFKARAYNFTFFDFEKLADYYAYQATPEEQRVFEKLALVLLDKDKLIENGFSKLINRIDDKPEDYETE